jgi:two-component system KDP operon response regulator KdpE
MRLTPTEFEILAILVRSRRRVVSYERLLQSLRQVTHCRDKRAFIWSLRQKLEDDPEHPRHVLTEKRIGYRLVKDPLRSLS